MPETPKQQSPENFPPLPELDSVIASTPAQNENAIDRDLNNFEAIMHHEKEQMKSEDFEEFRGVMHEIYHNISPEFSQFLSTFNSDLTKVMAKVTALAEKNDHYQALDIMTKFLDQQMTAVQKIKNPQVRDSMTAYIGAVINIDKLNKDMSARLKWETTSAVIDCVPVIGSAKMLSESASGKKMTGEKMNMTQRVTHGAAATAFLALDTVGIVLAFGSFGASEAAVVGVKGAARGVGLGVKGAELARSVSRLAKLVEATTSSTKASASIMKLSKLINKYPRLSGAIVKLSEMRGKVTPAKNLAGKSAGEAVKIVGKDIAKAGLAAGKKTALRGVTSQSVSRIKAVKNKTGQAPTPKKSA